MQSEPGPSHYKPNHNFLKKPPSQAKKSPPFLSSAVRNDKFAVKFFTGNSVSTARSMAYKNCNLASMNNVTFHVDMGDLFDITINYYDDFC